MEKEILECCASAIECVGCSETGLLQTQTPVRVRSVCPAPAQTWNCITLYAALYSALVTSSGHLSPVWSYASSFPGLTRCQGGRGDKEVSGAWHCTGADHRPHVVMLLQVCAQPCQWQLAEHAGIIDLYNSEHSPAPEQLIRHSHSLQCHTISCRG